MQCATGTQFTPARVRIPIHIKNNSLVKRPGCRFLRRRWDSLPAGEPRRLQCATGTLPRAAFRIPFPLLKKQKAPIKGCFLFLRRRWDSNPRTGYSPVYPISSRGRYDRFDTPPCMLNSDRSINAIFSFCEMAALGNVPASIHLHANYIIINDYHVNCKRNNSCEMIDFQPGLVYNFFR